ncbi:hypothetical protein [Brevundimonas sp.]|uniref:hypothetical protein n=1 Tax=Brevundimonas sp. TaxID=1871086 RepID=UPI00289E7B43|nr:hypothetical protein [Brevundimonas sp.]
MPMKHDEGSPLWGAPEPKWPGKIRIAVMVAISFALWAAIAGGVYWLTRLIAG